MFFLRQNLKGGRAGGIGLFLVFFLKNFSGLTFSKKKTPGFKCSKKGGFMAIKL